MLLDVNITEKSFGSKSLMNDVRFSVNDGEKIGLIGRNGVGKSTLLRILSGEDTDFTGELQARRGAVVVATNQEYADVGDKTVMQYILGGLPEYLKLSKILNEYPAKMGSNLKMIETYSEALERFSAKDFHFVEGKVAEELKNFGMGGYESRAFASLSGGQKRLTEVVKIMHASADLAVIDEPTNFMDYVAKAQFIEWLKLAPEAVVIITHDRDVLGEVDRIIEIKDGASVAFKGNYADYLAQNAVKTSTGMNEFEVTQRKIANLKKQVAYARSKKAGWSGTADKKNPFVVMEERALREIAKLSEVEKPSFWIDKDSVANLNYKDAGRYGKYKARNVRIGLKDSGGQSRRTIFKVSDLSLGYSAPLFSGLSFELNEGEVMEIRGRNGAGKSTLIKALLSATAFASSATKGRSGKLVQPRTASPAPVGTGRSRFSLGLPPSETSLWTNSPERLTVFSGEIVRANHVRVGIYEQEIRPNYFDLPLGVAIERAYLDRSLNITETKVRQLLADYLFVQSDYGVPLAELSGGQKARFQIISMLANDPELLILDEPTSHLDLPSIEELEAALLRYSGAILYVSHDGYFRKAIGGEVVDI